MKSQATVRSITRKPNVPGTPTIINITIDSNGKPSPGQDSTNVARGQQVTWMCTPPQEGTLSLCFDPFNAIVLATGTGSPQQPISLGPYTVVAEQPAQGQPGKAFHYHISWMTKLHGTHGVDPVIIVDPTNNPDE